MFEQLLEEAVLGRRLLALPRIAMASLQYVIESNATSRDTGGLSGYIKFLIASDKSSGCSGHVVI